LINSSIDCNNAGFNPGFFVCPAKPGGLKKSHYTDRRINEINVGYICHCLQIFIFIAVNKSKIVLTCIQADSVNVLRQVNKNVKYNFPVQ